MKKEHRTLEQLKEHYEIEKELANRLRNASKQQRRYLYSSLYNELYRRVPHHPTMTKRLLLEERMRSVRAQMILIKPFLNRGSIFVEIGPGDCALSLEVSKFVKQVYAIDVSDEITKNIAFPENFRLILSDGCTIPLPHKSVNIAYSNQLMEHLHPDDGFVQLQNIYNALVPNGVYLCITPNRLTGPHDISKYFDKEATCFHLKEYTVEDLYSLFKRVGFSKIRRTAKAKEFQLTFPVVMSIMFEHFLKTIPISLRRFLAIHLPFRPLLDVQLIGYKDNNKL